MAKKPKSPGHPIKISKAHLEDALAIHAAPKSPSPLAGVMPQMNPGMAGFLQEVMPDVANLAKQDVERTKEMVKKFPDDPFWKLALEDMQGAEKGIEQLGSFLSFLGGGATPASAAEAIAADNEIIKKGGFTSASVNVGGSLAPLAGAEVPPLSGPGPTDSLKALAVKEVERLEKLVASRPKDKVAKYSLDKAKAYLASFDALVAYVDAVDSGEKSEQDMMLDTVQSDLGGVAVAFEQPDGSVKTVRDAKPAKPKDPWCDAKPDGNPEFMSGGSAAAAAVANMKKARGC